MIVVDSACYANVNANANANANAMQQRLESGAVDDVCSFAFLYVKFSSRLVLARLIVLYCLVVSCWSCPWAGRGWS